MKKSIGFLILCMQILFAGAQNVSDANKATVPQTDYNRNALTVLVLDNSSSYIGDIKQAMSGVSPSEKFDDNSLATKSIASSGNVKSIQQSLTQNQIANQILAKWFHRQDDGTFNMEIIHERGMYNATHDEIQESAKTKRGMAVLRDAGEKLINQSYILVLEFSKVKSMKEIYDATDKKNRKAAKALGSAFNPVKRVKNGWQGEVEGYLYKLNFTDSAINVFYDDLWIYGDDSEKAKQRKKDLFNQTQFPIKFMLTAKGSADGTQYNPGNILASGRQLTRTELFQKLISTGIEACVFDIERELDDFQVKTAVFKANPISAKIGNKEGLKVDQRYFVLEFEMKRNGELKANRKGVVRTKEVANNKKVGDGQVPPMSTFYQTAGFGIEPGMLMQQKNDFGMSVSGGMAFGEIGGGWGKFELNVAQLAGGMKINQLRMFGYIGGDAKPYDIGFSTYDVAFFRWQVGLSKGFYFARNFSLAPFISYGQESGSSSDLTDVIPEMSSDDFFGSDFINIGAYFTMNILHNFQLKGGLTLYGPIGEIYTTDREYLSDYAPSVGITKYSELFDGRKGSSFELGVRVEF